MSSRLSGARTGIPANRSAYALARVAGGMYATTVLPLLTRRFDRIAASPNGLYATAGTGDFPRFTGVDAPYEPPTAPELTLRPDDGDPGRWPPAILPLSLRRKHRAPGGGHFRSPRPDQLVTVGRQDHYCPLHQHVAHTMSDPVPPVNSLHFASVSAGDSP